MAPQGSITRPEGGRRRWMNLPDVRVITGMMAVQGFCSRVTVVGTADQSVVSEAELPDLEADRLIALAKIQI